MPSLLPQAGSRSLARPLAIALVTLSLGGCLGRGGPDTTGSIDASASRGQSQAELRRASESLGERFQANPGDAAVAIQYGNTLKALDQNAQAVAVLQQAAIRNPRDLSALAAYGKALAAAGRLKEAAGVLARAHHPDHPDWRILSVQGAVADQLGDFATAQRYYEAALRIVPGEPSVLSNQGLSFALAKRLPEAERILVQAAQSPRADARVRQNLALVLGLEGKFAEAEGVLRRDLPPEAAARDLASIRRMVSQPNSWKAIRQSDRGAPKASAAAAAPSALRGEKSDG